jgi:peptidoglycan hydrolase CwlO-like protein
MANVFPNSNLASSSQPWGREVQKRVEILESQLSLERTNGATVDAQLQSSYRRLDQTVKDLIQADLDIQAALGQSNQAITDAASAASAAQTAANDAAAAALTANSAATNATSAINGLIGLGSSGSGYTLNVSNITTGGTLRDGVLTLDSGSNSSVAIFNGGVDINGPAGQ